MSHSSELQSVPSPTEAAAIIEVAQAAAEPNRVEDTLDPHVIVVPSGARAEVLDLERFGDAPRRKAGRYTVATVDAFNAYVGHHLDEQRTSIWVHPTDGTIGAVVNDHGRDGGDSAWRDHRVTLDLRKTAEWQHWMGRDGVLGGQVDFAEHVEDGLSEIVDPAAADLLEVAQTFHATTSAQFRQANRLADGRVQVRYDEEVEARAGQSGEMAIPQEITLAIAPFVGEEPYKLTARLRYRLAGGHLKIGYKLDRPERVLRDCLESIAERISEKFGDRVYLGSPPA